MLARVSLVAALLFSLAACGSSSPPAAPPAQTADDAGAATSPVDGSAPPPTDAGSTPDAASPATGLTWPDGQSFPVFAPLTTLDVADVSNATAEQHYLFCSLEGLVNRTRPRIYLQENEAEGATFWLDKLGVPTTAVADPMTLVTKYRSEIAGLVIYDPAVVDTVNLATTIAGVRGALVASPALAATLGAAPYSLTTLEDLRTHHFASAIDVYQYELATYASAATTRLIVGLNPTIADALRDYAVATRAMVVWLDPTNGAQAAVLQGFLSGLDSNAPYMGWWTDEPTGVNLASQYGVPTYAADFSKNLTVLGAPHTITVPTPPPPPPLENKAYVAVFMSDGDNLQEDQHLIPIKWADPKRGSVPISWTVQPGLAYAAPVILDYYWSTATPDDVLVSGPSGLGYTYPRSWPLQKFAEYTRRSADATARGGLRVITVWNDGQLLSGTPASLYASNMPHLLGVTDQLGTGGQSVVDGTLPLLVFASAYGGSETDLEAGIDKQLANFKSGSPLFVAVQGDMNQAAIDPTAFYAVQQHYASNPNVAFVRGDHLFQLIRKASGLPQDP